MIFGTPMTWKAALDTRAVKALMPTTLSSAELRAVDASLLERANFSSKVTNAKLLARLDRVVVDILNGKMSPQEGRVALAESLARAQYKATPGTEGTIEDLSSDVRLDLMIRTNVELAQGAANWRAGLDPDVLLVFPCAELKRVEGREVPRGTKEGYPDEYWQRRWVDLGGRLYGGRMICRKDDPLMSKVSEFGLPYGPPGFNSGYEWEDVRRDEAVELGVIAEDTVVRPRDVPLNRKLTTAATGLDGELGKALLEDLGSGYQIAGGVLESTTGGDGRVMDYGNESRLVEGHFSLPPADRWPDRERLVAHGLHIIVENPKGSIRSGVDKNGAAWSVRMPADYGEIHGFRGADGDYVDCYLGDYESDVVYVIDQKDIFAPGAPFDEHKCFLNFQTTAEARAVYVDGFCDGRGAERIGGETTFRMDEFKEWLRSKAKTKRPTLQAANAETTVHGYVRKNHKTGELVKVETHTRKLTFEEYLTKQDAIKVQRKKELEEELAKAGLDGVVELKSTKVEGKRLIVSPDVVEPRVWRVTQFDKHGPYGHHVFKSREAALRAALGEGFSDMVKGPPYHSHGDYVVGRVMQTKQEANEAMQEVLTSANVDLIQQMENDCLIANSTVQVKAHLRHLPTGGVSVVRQHVRKHFEALAGFPAVNDPANLTPETVLKESVYNRALRSMYFDPATNDKLTGSRDTPMERLPLTVGMWRIDDGWKGVHGHMISQLRELSPDELEHSEHLVEENIEGRGNDAERYAEWMKEGKQAPPIEVVVADRTNALRITDGHRRATAAKRAGVKVLAWVSPSAPHPEGYRYNSDPSEQIIPVALTYEIATGKPYPRE